MKVQFPSFAKINWFLEVAGRRSDGFHEIVTLFQAVDLADILSFDSNFDEIEFQVKGSLLPRDSENLVVRAAELVRESTGFQKGAKIELDKRIPVGGGLGGGSSNAAITLLALNYLWDCRLSLNHLKCLAAELGSDVPYFLIGGPCIGWGRGEKTYLLEDLDQERDLVVINPGFRVPTSLAFSLLGRPEIGDPADLTMEFLEHTIRRAREIIESGEWTGMRNDFEDSVYARFPFYNEFLGGWRGLESGKIMLTGSGSCLVAAGDHDFLDAVVASAENFIERSSHFSIFRCRSLSQQHYTEQLHDLFDYAGEGC